MGEEQQQAQRGKKLSNVKRQGRRGSSGEEGKLRGGQGVGLWGKEAWRA